MALLGSSAKKFLAGLVPGLLLALAYWGKSRLPALPASVLELVYPAPYLLFAVTAGLGLFFSRHKIVLAMLALAIAYGVIAYFQLQGAPRGIIHFVVVATVAFWLPLNLWMIAVQPDDQRLLGWRSAFIAGVLFVELGLSYWLLSTFPNEFTAFILFPAQTGVDLSAWTKLSIPALITSLLAAAVLLWRLLRQFNLITAGLFWVVVGTALAFDTLGAQPQFALLFALSTLIVAVALLQTWYDLAYLDQLTGLPGRLALNELIKGLKGNYVVAMVDVDHFKKFNDNHGHDVGDQILKLVASKLRQVTGGGTAFRYGGEEFTVVFPGKRIKEVFSHLSTLREMIEEAHMILRNKPRPPTKPAQPLARKQPLRYLNVTVSIGIAEKNEELNTPAVVIKAADEALYRAKERGRNRLSL